MDDQPDHFGKGWQDTVTVLCCTFMLISALLLAHITTRAKASSETAETASPGSVIFTADWDPALDTDVDLWVRGPGDVPVGYSNKGGGLFNLLRDDLGHLIDVSGMNAEISYSRGWLPGLYVANVHLYRLGDGRVPMTVKVVASLRDPKSGAVAQIAQQTVNLKVEGAEVTAMRFRLGQDGKLVPDSVDNVQTPLRSAKVK